MAEFHDFPGPEAVADFAAERVAALLRDGVAERDAGSLVVPGGRTPGLFLSELAVRPLAWDKVSVTLSDERWVDEHSLDSNEALVRRTLLTHAASSAHFVPLYNGALSPESGLIEASRHIETMPRPWDAVVLGIGDDGHFASLFPGEPALAIGLDPAAPQVCVPARGPGGGPPRLSLTLSCLARARHIFILATGAHKRGVWQVAAQDTTLPAAALHRLTGVPVDFLWCP